MPTSRPYPLVLIPIARSGVSGTGLLGQVFPGLKIPAGVSELILFDSATARNQILNGAFAGRRLSRLLQNNTKEILGRMHDNSMPTLNISVRETSDQEPLMACYGGPGVNGCDSRYWFCMASLPGSKIAAGLKHRISRAQFEARQNSGAIEDILEVATDAAGDSFFMPPGNVFGARAGNVIIELSCRGSQSEVVSNWGDDEVCAPANAEAAAKLNFVSRRGCRIRRDAREHNHTCRIPLVSVSPDFSVEEVRLFDFISDRTDSNFWHLLCPVVETLRIESNNETFDVPPGTICLIPTDCSSYRLTPKNRSAVLLRIIPRGALVPMHPA